MLSNITDNCTITYLVQPEPGCVKDTPTDEIVVMILLILLVIYTFHRLYYVWVNTLNPNQTGGGPIGPPGFKSLISREPKVGLTSNQAVNLSLSVV